MRYLPLLLLAACAANVDPPSRYSAVTPAGVRADLQGAEIDLEAVDRAVAAFEACAGTELPEWRLLVNDEWFVNYTGNQVWACEWAPPGRYCAGTTYTAMEPQVVELPPDMHSLGHELIHLITDKSHDSPLFGGPCEDIRLDRGAQSR